MSSISAREHFERIARAVEEDLEQELERLTVEEASLLSEVIQSTAPHVLSATDEPQQREDYIPLRELIRRHQESRGKPTPASPPRGHRRAG